ncbi:hypothetical protein A9G00_10305 [Achromobacter xylosoxidans]|nr:hypothetical protein A9G00_10305 [Achromobacter xylosoxidans]
MRSQFLCLNIRRRPVFLLELISLRIGTICAVAFSVKRLTFFASLLALRKDEILDLSKFSESVEELYSADLEKHSHQSHA